MINRARLFKCVYIPPSEKPRKDFLMCYNFALESRDLCASDSNIFHSKLMYNLCRPGSSWVFALGIFTKPLDELGLFPTNSPNAAHMHRDVICYTSQASFCSSHLFLLVGCGHTRGASNSCSGLYGCVRHRNVAEVVLADSLDGVCVCRR